VDCAITNLFRLATALSLFACASDSTNPGTSSSGTSSGTSSGIAASSGKEAEELLALNPYEGDAKIVGVKQGAWFASSGVRLKITASQVVVAVSCSGTATGGLVPAQVTETGVTLREKYEAGTGGCRLSWNAGESVFQVSKQGFARETLSVGDALQYTSNTDGSFVPVKDFLKFAD
jgi:hypothetical protein